MKIIKNTITFLIASLMLISTIAGALAQKDEVASVTELETEPLLIPGDTFYFLKTIKENFGLITKQSKETQAKYRLRLANERLKEMIALQEKGKTDDLAETKERYEKELEQAELSGLKISDLARQKEFEQKLQLATQYHIGVLNKVLTKVENEQARTAIQNILQRANATQENTKVVLKTRNETSRINVEVDSKGFIRVREETKILRDPEQD